VKNILREKPIYVIVGPTASGKSELGIALALKIGGEIINCDSVQIYREIEIATAKVSAAEMRGVPHHLLDYVSPETNYTAADWARDAAEKIKKSKRETKSRFLSAERVFICARCENRFLKVRRPMKN
jgi:tRNA dimethylallyltransferase